MFGSNQKKAQKYFTVIPNLQCSDGWIVYDNFTRVMYYKSRGGGNTTSTLTLLVNQDGSPRIYTGE
jgi:hypothetical protein